MPAIIIAKVFTFEGADSKYDDVRLRVCPYGVHYTAIDFVGSMDFLKASDERLNRKKLIEFVGYVERRIVHHIPKQTTVT